MPKSYWAMPRRKFRNLTAFRGRRGERSWTRVGTVSEVGRLLAAYDAQLRGHVHDRLPDSVRVERDGPLVRTLRFGKRGFVEYRDLAGVDGNELDALIARAGAGLRGARRALRVEAARARSP